MSHVDFIFVETLRFSIIASVLLLVTLVAIRFLDQPLERVRVIQISWFALVATFALGLLGVVPVLEMALLPVDSTSTVTANATSVVGLPGKARSATRAEGGQLSPLPFEGGLLNSGKEAASAAGASGGVPSATPQATTISADSIGDIGFVALAKRVFVYGFFFISILNAVYLAIGFVATYRLIASSTSLSTAAADRVERIINQFAQPQKLHFVRSANIDVPIVSGIWRPTVLLPESLSCSDADERELKHCLAHEWGHIERQDLLMWQLVSLCQVFLWIQPCYWVLRRDLRIAQDQLTDQFATQQADDHSTYAETLLQLSRAGQFLLPGALAMAGGKSNLYRRIEMLMNDKFRMARVARKTVILPFAALMTFAGILLTSLQLTHAAPAPAPANQRNDDERDDEPLAGKEGLIDAKWAEHSGVVIDADTNMPIAGVTVTVTRMNSRDWRELAVTESTTDENGRYTFTIPPDQLSQRLLYIAA